MKLTIIADDQSVGIDGEYFTSLDLPQLNSNIHAGQWYGEYGEVEYKTRYENGVLQKPENLLITDVESFQFAIDTWNAAKAAVEAALAAAIDPERSGFEDFVAEPSAEETIPIDLEQQ